MAGLRGSGGLSQSALLEVIRAILDQSQDPPIIVLMGDHGMAFDDLEDRLSNLNALLIPSPVELYPTITPVNTFRLIFDGVFGTSLGKLPDISYYSSGKDRFNVVTVPNTWRPGSR